MQSVFSDDFVSKANEWAKLVVSATEKIEQAKIIGSEVVKQGRSEGRSDDEIKAYLKRLLKSLDLSERSLYYAIPAELKDKKRAAAGALGAKATDLGRVESSQEDNTVILPHGNFEQVSAPKVEIDGQEAEVQVYKPEQVLAGEVDSIPLEQALHDQQPPPAGYAGDPAPEEFSATRKTVADIVSKPEESTSFPFYENKIKRLQQENAELKERLAGKKSAGRIIKITKPMFNQVFNSLRSNVKHVLLTVDDGGVVTDVEPIK